MSALLTAKKDSKRITAKKDSKRSRILEAAKRQFSRVGIKGTTMQDIAREAEIAVGTIYKFFPDKDALILAWVEEHRQLLFSQMDETLQGNVPADEKLRNFLRVRFQTVAEVRDKPAVTELSRAVLRLTPEVIGLMTQTVLQYLEGILEEGRRTHVLPSARPKEDAEILFLALAAFFTTTTDRFAPPSTEENMLRVVNWFIAKWKLPLPKSQS